MKCSIVATEAQIKRVKTERAINTVQLEVLEKAELQNLTTDLVIDMSFHLSSFNSDDKKDRREFLKNFFALRNTGGGILRIYNMDKNPTMDRFFQTVEGEINDLSFDKVVTGPLQTVYEYLKHEKGEYVDFFIRGTSVPCADDLMTKTHGDGRLLAVKPKELVNLIQQSHPTTTPEPKKRVKAVQRDDRYPDDESKELQFKEIRLTGGEEVKKDKIKPIAGDGVKRDKIGRIKERLEKILPEYVAAFAKREGSIIFGVAERAKGKGKQKTQAQNQKGNRKPFQEPYVTGILLDNQEKITIEEYCRCVIMNHTSWFRRKQKGHITRENLEKASDTEISEYFRVFIQPLDGDFCLIEVSVSRFPGVVFSSSGGPSAHRVNLRTKNVERIDPKEWIALLCGGIVFLLLLNYECAHWFCNHLLICSFAQVSCYFICGRRRVALAQHRMICFALSENTRHKRNDTFNCKLLLFYETFVLV